MSSLAAGEGQHIGAKSHHWDIDSLSKQALEEDLWHIGKRGACTGAIKPKLDRNIIGQSASILDLVVDSRFKALRDFREIVLYTQAIKQALQNEHVSAARDIFAAIPSNLAGDPGLLSIGRVLALPVVHVTMKRDVDRSQEFSWLRTEGYKYRGQWVAIENNQLLLTAPTLKGLRDQLKNQYPDRAPLIHRVV